MEILCQNCGATLCVISDDRQERKKQIKKGDILVCKVCRLKHRVVNPLIGHIEIVQETGPVSSSE